MQNLHKQLKTYKDYKYVIVTHSVFTGASQDLYKYLKKNKISSLLLEHSFSIKKDRISKFTYFNGEKEDIKNTKDYKFLPDNICYIKDILYSFFGILFNKRKYDVYVGAGGFNAFPGIFLRLFGKVKKTIFYTIDYVPTRFSNKLLNSIYHSIDKFCVKHTDQTWNLSPKMSEGRQEYNNMPVEKYKKQKVVPIGIWTNELPNDIQKHQDKRQLVFVGHLIEKQGVQIILRAIPDIIKVIPDFYFLIIGDGEFKINLENIVKDLGIQEYVCFKGAIYDNSIINKYLGESHIAAAMYDKKLDRFTCFADPTKLKVYLAMGLPIILTDVPHNANDIQNKGCGKIIEYNEESVKNAVIALLQDEERLDEYSRNAVGYMKKYDWNLVFEDALREIF